MMRSAPRCPTCCRAIRAAGYAAGTARIRIPIKHMHCASCVTRIERALQVTPGVIAADANLLTNAVDVEYQPEQTSFAAIRRAIESAGHKVAEPKPTKVPEDEGLSPEEAAQREEYRTLMRKFWLAAAIAIPVMGLSYPDLIPGLRDWMPAGSETRRIIWALLGVASLPVLLWSGSQFFSGMWDALRHRSANMHTLIAIGITAAFLYSVVAVADPGLFPAASLAEVFWDALARCAARAQPVRNRAPNLVAGKFRRGGSSELAERTRPDLLQPGSRKRCGGPAKFARSRSRYKERWECRRADRNRTPTRCASRSKRGPTRFGRAAAGRTAATSTTGCKRKQRSWPPGTPGPS